MPKIIDAVVTDGDNTLWKGAVSTAIGKEYLAKAFREYDVPAFVSGAARAAQVLLMAKFMGHEGPSAGQKRFYNTLIANGIGRKNELCAFAGQHIRNNTIEKVENIVRYYSVGSIPVFLSTMAGTTAAEYATESFRLAGSVSNTEMFDSSGRLVEFSVTMYNGEEKLANTESMVNKYNVMLRDCMVIGDSANDIPLLKSAKIALASPFASDEVLALKRITRLSS